MVRPIVVEASPDGTEARLLAELRRLVPQLPVDCDLAEAIALVRDDPQARRPEKLLVVLDQVEQWLQGRPIEPAAELIRAFGSATAGACRRCSWCGTTSGWRPPAC